MWFRGPLSSVPLLNDGQENKLLDTYARWWTSISGEVQNHRLRRFRVFRKQHSGSDWGNDHQWVVPSLTVVFGCRVFCLNTSF